MEVTTIFSASPAPSRQTPGGSSEPKIQHSFDGDVKVLNSTFECRTEIRKTLSNLQQLLQRVEGRDVQVVADIKLRITGSDPKEHTYSVTINDPKLDVEAFSKQFPSAKKIKGCGDDDDLVEIRPFKKARMDTDDGTSFLSSNRDTDGLLKDIIFLLKQRSSTDPLDFLKQWHSEWVKQGGWLFDSVNKAEKLANTNQAILHSRMASVQDVLGQSMNAASASAMAELNNISKLIPWVEACRKSAADKAQAREEKWRTSSATFHDQNRRDRETAEERLLEEVQRQRGLLERVARANGVEVREEEKEAEMVRGEEKRDHEERDHEEREASLGAQLTAELNMEASRASEKGAVEVELEAEVEKPRETVSIDDDDEDGGEVGVAAVD
ncbi:hypothetical protein B0A55_04761 [Friedmanniomyces simplex]|uniref:Uncharacterized protein n=1 Tax=Friedmanniomyces simplex TaxID=329884 RepID=A0A4U0XJS6_9PEZI|nr:hypothetical protein B0A55_04761 [Friedmanniomyces simplex]